MLFRPRIFTPIAIAVALLSAGPAGAVDYVWLYGSATANGMPAVITIDDTLSIGCPTYICATKTLDMPITNNGVVMASDTLYFLYNNALTNGWQYQLQGDVGLIDGGYGGRFINESSGSLVKTSGTGTSSINISMQSRSGSILDAITGTIAFTGSSSASFESNALLLANAGAAITFAGANVSFADGVRLLGAGQFTVASNASYGGNIGATQLSFTGGSQTGGDGTAGSHATLTSDATWSGSGSLNGQWTVGAGNTLTATGAGTRIIAAGVTNLGTINTDNTLYFQYGNVLTNRGLVQMQGDIGLVDGGYGGTLVNSGTLAKVSGSGTSSISNISVNNSGRIDAQMGTIEFNGGGLYFSDGSRFTGAGKVVISSAANFSGAISSSNLVLAGASYQGGTGAAASKATLSGSTRWTGGSLAGSFELAADHTLTLAPGSTHTLQGSLNNRGVINASDTLYLLYGNTLSNAGQLNLQGDVSLLDGGYGGHVVNEIGASVVKTQGAGTTTINVDWASRAGSSLEVQTGAIAFATSSARFDAGATLTANAGTAIIFGGSTSFADGASLLGAGQFTVASNASYGGNIGATQLSFTGGSQTGGDGTAGSHATLTSDATWSGSGSLNGQWTVGAGNTLTATGAGTRIIAAGVTNLGTINTDNTLYFQYGNVLTNRGLVQMQGDIGLVDGGYGGTLVNSGTLAKVSGSGTSSISNISVNNSGRIDAQMGTIEFNGGGLYFSDGSRFTGAGKVVISSAANFSGAISSSNLVLAGASYQGGTGAAASKATLSGSTRWTGGSLAGSFELAADHTLTLAPGSTHTLQGSLNNRGVINASDTLYLLYGNTLSNAGQLNLQGDVSLLDGGYGGHVVNSGRLVKTAGAGESNLSGISVSNTGSIEVQSGSIRLPSAFTNDGTLTGTGSFVSADLSNNGHLAPGAAALPGTLTVVGNLSQAASASLDIGLKDASHFGLLQVQGNVALGGILSLSCVEACSFTAGTDLRILDGSGTLTGSFDSVSIGSFAPGAFSVFIDTAQADVWLHVNDNISAVPEPKNWAMLLGGLGVVAQLARRRRRTADAR